MDLKSQPGTDLTIRCIVELFGVARLLAKTREVALNLPPPASLGDIYNAVSERHPVLLGRVIGADGRSLTRGYACNINGVDFVRDINARVNSGDRIFIISADAGG
jgi:molybdopterin converting factor small subunit